MLKYKNLMMIAILIVGSIGTFYVQSAFAKDDLPRYTIHSLKGDKNAVKDIRLIGSMESNEHYSESVLITNDETKYQSEASFINQFFGGGIFTSGKILSLQKKYHSFMRGKTDLNGFYEDQNRLIYVKEEHSGSLGTMSHTFDIDILNKKKNKKDSFQINLPNGKDIHFIEIIDVKIIDDELKVVTSNFNNSGEEIRVYSIDLPSKSLVGNNVIASNMNEDRDIETFFSGYQELGEMSSVPSVFYNLSKTRMVLQDSGESVQKEISKETFMYDLEKNKKRTIHFPTKINKENLLEPQYYYDKGNIYIVGATDKGIKVFIYDYIHEKLVKQYDFSVNLENSDPPLLAINKDQLFIVSNPNEKQDPIEIKRINVLSGKITFQGEIKASKTSDQLLKIQEIEIN